MGKRGSSDTLSLSSYYNKNDEYIKSNFLISAKYKTTLLEARLLAIALNKISQNDVKIDKEGSIIVHMRGTEIRDRLKSRSGSLYERLEAVAPDMIHRSIGFSDPVNHRFNYFNIINNAKYDDGVFTIIFNKETTLYLHDIKTNYSILSISMMLSFKSIYSFRLYELLRSNAYTAKGKRDNGKYKYEMKVSELYLCLGIVNAELTEVRHVLVNQEIPDYDLATRKAEEKLKSFQSWGEFKRSCLDPARKEINEKSDIRFDYETIKSGRGGKVNAVEFYIEKKAFDENLEEVTRDDNSSAMISDEKKSEVIVKLIRLIPDIGLKDAEAIAKAADYDYELISHKYELSNGNERNIVGWLIDAVKKDYILTKAVEIERPNGKHIRDESKSNAQEYVDFAKEQVKKQRKRVEQGV